MIDYESIKFEDNAIYINFPFCKLPCSYCHYVDNLSFGHNSIPDDYFRVLKEQLNDTLKQLVGIQVDSIYFGGGTPSLLNDAQCECLHLLFKKYNISSNEISIEIHPGMCNFDYVNNTFFTRYSIGVQSFDSTVKKEYRRTSYTVEDVVELIQKIRSNSNPKIINIDLIFETILHDIDIKYINLLKPETVTFYPNTKGRGFERLVSILKTLDWVKKEIEGYHPLGKSKYIYVRNDSQQSYYSKLEYEKNGNIIGIGHNSVSYIKNTSYLCRYENGKILIKERKGKKDRILNSIMIGISSGVTKGNILKYLPETYKHHFFMTVNEEIDILDKHIEVKDSELVYLPDDEYIRFNEFLINSGRKDLSNTFLGSIGFGDSTFEVIDYVYNKILLLDENEISKLKKITGKTYLKKVSTPNIKILIEGIDGSGKDTFARLMLKELRKRFLYEEGSKISITGEPNSKMECGKEAKKFIEDVEYNGDWDNVKSVLTRNRIATEKYIKELPGITILIRGLVTDKATFYRIFKKDINLGEGCEIEEWYRYIVIDIPPEVADIRIHKRGIPRTWREFYKHLKFFREFYIKYENQIFKRKTIIENLDMEYLKKEAVEIADEIYADTVKSI